MINQTMGYRAWGGHVRDGDYGVVWFRLQHHPMRALSSLHLSLAFATSSKPCLPIIPLRHARSSPLTHHFNQCQAFSQLENCL